MFTEVPINVSRLLQDCSSCGFIHCPVVIETQNVSTYITLNRM